MAPKGEMYSQVEDYIFDEWMANSLVSEFSIDIVAFWKYNVKVISYEETYTVDGDVISSDSFIATATTTPKSGFQLYVNTGSTGESILEPALNSANYYEPILFYFNATDFFTHRNKWYIHDRFSSTDGTITADFSSLVVEYGPANSRTKISYDCLETFY